MILPFLLAATVTTAHAAPASAPAATPAKASAPVKLEKPSIEPKTESNCGVVVAVAKEVKKGDKPAYDYDFKEVAGLKVLGGPQKLALPKAEGNVVAVRCTRDTIVPGDGDGRVVWELGKELSLSDGPRMGVLGLTQPEKGKLPQYRFAVRKGTLTEAEKKAVSDRLNILQANLVQLAREVQAERAKAAKAKAADAPIAAKKQ
ncbi:MAG TPA: hypothetical protein VG407_13910 [Caulobacteraceae bacterium]|jgi:hypothetical protein|nr:hypothetical protein [Caulobacteraceae bacterium]